MGKLVNTDNIIIFFIKMYQILDSRAKYLGIWTTNSDYPFEFFPCATSLNPVPQAPQMKMKIIIESNLYDCFEGEIG